MKERRGDGGHPVGGRRRGLRAFQVSEFHFQHTYGGVAVPRIDEVRLPPFTPARELVKRVEGVGCVLVERRPVSSGRWIRRLTGVHGPCGEPILARPMLVSAHVHPQSSGEYPIAA